MQTAALHFRNVEPHDAASVLALFRRVFLADGTGNRSRESWHWRFLTAPLGNESCLAEEPRAGCILAHVGGTPHATVWDGALRRSIECVDHMVAPELRRGLRRTSLFARLQRHWFSAYCRGDHDFLAWGFPSDVDFRVGQRFAGYSLVRTVNVLVCQDSSRFRHPAGITLRPAARVGAEADALWAHCQPGIGCAVVRDAAHLSWRYDQCPHQAYALIEARDDADGSLRGQLVLRRGGISPDVAMIMELLAPHGDDDALHALLGEAARWTAGQQLCALVAWFPECTREFGRLQELGFRVRPTPMLVAGRSWDPGIDVAAIRNRFYMSFGDMDAW